MPSRVVPIAVMQLAEILPSARLLNAADKLHLIRVLVTDIDDGESMAPLEHGRSYRVSTPQFADGAAEALQRELAAGQIS